jgi:beta-lactamase regulating signal transducer with metallopeptidase domain
MSFTDLILSPDVVKALGWTLIHSLWQGMIISGMTWVVLFLLRRSRATLRYLVLSGSMLMIVAVTIVTFLVVNRDGKTAGQSSPRTAVTVQPAIDNGNSVSPAEVSSSYFLSNYLHKLTHFVEANGHLMVLVWFTGFLFFVLKYVGGLFYIGMIRRKSLPLKASGWQDVTLQIARRSGLRKKISILESAYVKVPVTIGHIKPLILFPLGMISRIPPEQVEAILMHEMAHIIRRDYLCNLLQSVVEAVFFYHPAIWWISRKIRMEREIICDDIALSQSIDPLTYIKALTTMEELSANPPVMAHALTGKKKHLLNRIRRLVHSEGSRYRGSEGLLTVMALFMMVFLIGAGTNLKALEAGDLSRFSEPAIHPEAISSLTGVSSMKAEVLSNDPLVPGIAAPAGPITNVQDHDVEKEIIQPDTALSDTNDKERQQEAMFAKQEALEMLEQAKQMQKQAMMEYQEALEKYNEVLREYGEKDWHKEFKWVYVDSLDSLHVMVMPDLEDVYFYGRDQFKEPFMPQYRHFDHKPGKYSYSYKYRKPDKWDVIEDEDNMKIIIKDLESDAIWDLYTDYDVDVDVDFDVDQELEEEIERVRKEMKEHQKQFDKQVIVTRPDIRAPRMVREPHVFVERGPRPGQIIHQELKEDGLIRPGKEYIVELGPDAMYINGEKQSKSTLKKYKRIYEGISDEELIETVKLIF